MGCFSGTPSSSTVLFEVREIRISFEMQINKLENQLQKQLTEYENTLKKPQNRNATVEYQLLSQATTLMNMQHIHKVAMEHCSRLIEYKHLFDKPEHFGTLRPDFEKLLFIESIVGNDRLMRLSAHLREKYPQLKETKIDSIDDQILNHYKTDTVASKKMVNEFALKLCNAREWNMEWMNESGNKFGYM